MLTFSHHAALLLGQLFLTPLDVPNWLRLWLFLPLTLCVAVVYRATRARTAADLPLATLITFANIVLGMVAIALAAYGIHQFALWMS